LALWIPAVNNAGWFGRWRSLRSIDHRRDREGDPPLRDPWEGGRVKATRYFEEQVLRKRPYIDRAWCAAVIAAPLRCEVQSDGRIRFWGEVRLPGEDVPRVLRVVTLEDGETVHNAFFDRNFNREAL
jgi:hypothetical protein